MQLRIPAPSLEGWLCRGHVGLKQVFSSYTKIAKLLTLRHYTER